MQNLFQIYKNKLFLKIYQLKESYLEITISKFYIRIFKTSRLIKLKMWKKR